MNKTIVFVVCLALGAGIVGCGSDEESESAAPPSVGAAPSEPAAEPEEDEGPAFRTTVMGMEMAAPLVTRDLAEAGLEGLTIVAPEEAELRTTSWGSHTVVDAGVNYSVSINEGEFDAESSLSGWQALDPDGTIVEQTDEQVIYQRSGGGSLLFVVGVSVGDTAYTCGTTSTAFPFTRDQVDQMITSCRTLAAAEG